MNLSDFDYHLPAGLIAQTPLPERTASRLLHLDKSSGTLTHQSFTNLSDYLKPNDLLVLNDTQVVPARLFGTKPTGGKVEIFLERILSLKQALVQMSASKKLDIDTVIDLSNGISVKIVGRAENLYILEFQGELSSLAVFETLGEVPIPPYVNRPVTDDDKIRYQTVVAQHKGAVAAPTAGLHFDKPLLSKLQEQGINYTTVTLHVGMGTFKPVRVEDITQHQVHKEYMQISASVCEQIQQTKAQGGRIIAVGTTSVRVLETAGRSGVLTEFQGDTDLFIYPGFKFNIVDAILTNFHIPKSSLLMLICAFGGYENVMHAYREAVEQQYRFYSYGDAMLIT